VSAVIAFATSAEDIRSCFAVMKELRPHLVEGEFLKLVRHLSETTRFQLAFVAVEGQVKAVAGFRISEWLAAGRYLEIEDLVAKEGERSHGHGGALFDWLVAYARERDCDQVRLVSRMDRENAHRFYERKGMTRFAYYFSMNL
jgi:ribosomal protein S18 acetylase RimI-like enzyme